MKYSLISLALFSAGALSLPNIIEPSLAAATSAIPTRATGNTRPTPAILPRPGTNNSTSGRPPRPSGRPALVPQPLRGSNSTSGLCIELGMPKFMGNGTRPRIPGDGGVGKPRNGTVRPAVMPKMDADHEVQMEVRKKNGTAGRPGQGGAGKKGKGKGRGKGKKLGGADGPLRRMKCQRFAAAKCAGAEIAKGEKARAQSMRCKAQVGKKNAGGKKQSKKPKQPENEAEELVDEVEDEVEDDVEEVVEEDDEEPELEGRSVRLF